MTAIAYCPTCKRATTSGYCATCERETVDYETAFPFTPSRGPKHVDLCTHEGTVITHERAGCDPATVTLCTNCGRTV